MSRLTFVNLPVADVAAARRFFGALGFTFDERFSDETATAMPVNEQSVHDPDGHHWEVIWMDSQAAEQGPPDMAEQPA